MEAAREAEGESQSGTVSVFKLLPLINRATECQKPRHFTRVKQNLLKLFQHFLAHSDQS